MHTRLFSALIPALLLLSACNLSSEPAQNRIPTPTNFTNQRPVVVITSPQSGAEFTVDQQIIVTATATDPIGITRVQLLANGSIVKTVSSELPTGSQSLPAVLDYTPRQAGAVNLSVVAFRSSVASDPALITVNVRDRQAQVTATAIPNPGGPVINPNDPTCRVLTNVGLNVRQGPGTNYNRISVMAAGTVVPITGRNADNSWWQVRVGTTIGWVTDEFVTVYGNCINIPIVQAPPPPTNTPAPVTPTIFSPTFTPQPPPPTTTPGLPDLLVTNISGASTLVLGAGGVTSNYAVTVTNTGLGPTGQFNNLVTILPLNTTLPLGVVGSLRPGESIILNVGITFSAPGSYTLQVRADSDSQVTELSEVNNLGIFTVTVSNP
jgi:uncharacterized protein YraI